MDALEIALAILAACVVLLFLAPPPLAADGTDLGRLRVQAHPGELAALEDLLRTLHRDFDGQAIAIALESESPGWTYRVRLLRADGAVDELAYDARTLALQGIRSAGIDVDHAFRAGAPTCATR